MSQELAVYGADVKASDINKIFEMSSVYNIESFDSANAFCSTIITGLLRAVALLPTGTPQAIFKIPMSKINIDFDLYLSSVFNFADIDAGTSIKLKLEVLQKQNGDTIDFTGATEYEDEINLTAGTEIFTQQLFSINKDIFVDNEGFLLCRLSRINSGLIGTNIAQNLNIISLTSNQ